MGLKTSTLNCSRILAQLTSTERLYCAQFVCSPPEVSVSQGKDRWWGAGGTPVWKHRPGNGGIQDIWCSELEWTADIMCLSNCYQWGWSARMFHYTINMSVQTHTEREENKGGSSYSRSDCVQDEIISQLLSHADGGWSFKTGAAVMKQHHGGHVGALPVCLPHLPVELPVFTDISH